ncbi:cyclin-T1 [Trichomycterus rosablanca]|uniref:cyclin-T1 n=1 Tax=Trichomycterus rosablanca TaxID=2290929 RepID=UPI002F354FE3
MAAALLARSGNQTKWYFTREQIQNSPSRRAGLDPDKELSYRQQAANLIQDIGQRLNVSQLTINTAIVYMHRFYMIQTFIRFHRNAIAPAALFLATKVEEQPRKLEHVVKVANAYLNPQDPSSDVRKTTFQLQAQDVVVLENIILQTLAFEIRINHPHTHVVKCTELVRASKDLAQTSYFMATNSLHLTTFCLQYCPTVVACVCIHLACKWSNWEIPVSTDSKHWWEYVDPTVTLQLLDELTNEFLQILEKTPSRLKRIRNWKAPGQLGKKLKVQEDGEKTQVVMNMIPTASPESPLASLMSISAPLATSSSSMILLAEEKQQLGIKEPEPPVPTRVSLSDYRAKHADELAAQKKKLENMEASVKRDYASAAQALISQQRKEKHHHHQQLQSSSGSSEPIILKIPLDERQDRSSLKIRLPGSSHGAEQNIKVKIRLPDKGSREEKRSKEKHKERSNHHHHHHHHHHSSSSGSSSSSSSHKHSSSTSASSSSKKSSSDLMKSNSSTSSSRKRTHSSEPTASSHSAKISKSSRNVFHLPTDVLPSLGISHHQGGYSHGKVDKVDTNGHGINSGGQSNDYQDTFDMLNSLLSAQGVQPAPPQVYDYHAQYGDYRFARPPLPLEPPPELPPLPK